MSIRISQLPTATSIDGSEYVVLVQNGITKKILSTALSSATDASLLTTGTMNDARLSSNVPLKDEANIFTQSQTLNGDLIFTGSTLHVNDTTLEISSSVSIDGSFTAVNGSFVDLGASGSISAEVSITTNGSITTGGSITSGSGFIGDGSQLTNVAILNLANEFTETQTITSAGTSLVLTSTDPVSLDCNASIVITKPAEAESSPAFKIIDQYDVDVEYGAFNANWSNLISGTGANAGISGFTAYDADNDLFVGLTPADGLQITDSDNHSVQIANTAVATFANTDSGATTVITPGTISVNELRLQNVEVAKINLPVSMFAVYDASGTPLGYVPIYNQAA